MLIAAIAVVLTAWAATDPYRFISGDWPTLLLPPYAFLGERLRAGDLPGWNPHQFAGYPFIGDPNSGWAYLPTMLCYALFPPALATILYIGCHLLIAGLATYLLARALRLNAAGAFVAGLSMMVPWALLASRQVPYHVSVSAWIPVALLGAELALRAERAAPRLAGWALGGLAVSQILGVWLGKGAYYGLLALGAWVAYRTLVVAPWPMRPGERARALLLHGAALLLIGLGLGAAGVLPRLDANARSTIPGGVYNGALGIHPPETAWGLADALGRLAGTFTQTRWIVGAATFGLAALAVVAARRWFATPYFLFLGIGALLLATGERTPLHAALFALLPRFEAIHEHDPALVIMLVPLPAAMLAGATVSYLTGSNGFDRWAIAVGLALAAGGLAARLALHDDDRLTLPLLSLAAAAALAACVAALPGDGKRLALASLVVVLSWQPALALVQKELGPDPAQWGTLYQASEGNVGRFLSANPVAAAIANAPGGPSRYVGYDPALLNDTKGGDIAYRNAADDPGAHWLLVNNWATWFGIDTTQGFNAMQVARYVELVTAMNGQRQEYHGANLFPHGLDSPLLNLLGVRSLIVPADAPARADLAPLAAAQPTVYADDNVRILNNAAAFPRAWLVHEARQVMPGESLALLADGTVDPRRVALLEAPPPELDRPQETAGERVALARNDPDEIVVTVDAAAPGLLVMSDVWDPGWSATADGAPAPVLLADHAFRAVPVGAGRHRVALRYDPPLLRLGLGVTFATLALVGAALALAAYRERRGRRSDGVDDGEGRSGGRCCSPPRRRHRPAAHRHPPSRIRARWRTDAPDRRSRIAGPTC